ncbi:hypothetical protein ACFO0N_21810 [Halobium salinum]|uniref:Transglutaminase-like domain-containing protein n=1 Tax=Halobium salinum TaxID=1364940 RepID=A0ABD5PI77_9EURY|nr:hypothetical protein [Halobium salinum]
MRNHLRTAATRVPRWTPFVFLAPDRYVADGEFWAEFDFRTWSRRGYEWVSDPWNGFRDVAKRPRETLAEGRGDCEDYALVAASWARARGHEGVGLGFCLESPYPWPRHAIAYDDRFVYSSGRIFVGRSRSGSRGRGTCSV